MRYIPTLVTALHARDRQLGFLTAEEILRSRRWSPEPPQNFNSGPDIRLKTPFSSINRYVSRHCGPLHAPHRMVRLD
jgi:hypothetical protein